jgi:hypothetical protein
VSTRRLTLFHPLLFAAYAVLFLYAENVDITAFHEVWPALLVAVVGAAIALAVTTWALRDRDAGAIMATVLVLLFFFATPPLKALLSNVHPPPAMEGLIRGGLLGLELLLVSLTAILASVVLARRARASLPAINTALTVGAVVLLAFPLATLATTAANAKQLYTAGPSQLAAQRKPDRDIYYLILDRYGTPAANQYAFGVDNNELSSWLEEHGFYVASQARANYDRTGLSVPATLSLNYIDGIVQALGPTSTDYESVFEMIQDHKVGRFLKEQGYDYIHLGNWFGPLSHIRIADENLRPGGLSEFEATLYDQTALSSVGALATLQAPIPVIELLQYDSARYQFATLAQLADDPGPKFVFAHVLLPHDPLVFQQDGSFYTSAERGDLSESGRFEAQLSYLNGQVEEFVEDLLGLPEDEQPIVVIQADEGPQPIGYRQQQKAFDWTKASDDEIRAKFGILDAFFLPPDPNLPSDAPRPYPTISSVNTFRLIFDRYFGTKLGFLPDRSYVARIVGYPFDQMEITDVLNEAP